MPRETISPEQRAKEAEKLRSFFGIAQSSDESITQESIANEMEVTQGLIHQWLSGRSPIPNKRLVWLSKRLGFDAHEVREKIKSDTDLIPTGKQKVIIDRYLTNPDFRRMVDTLAESTGHFQAERKPKRK